MNKFKTILLSILGGIDVTFNMFTPIIIAALWVSLGSVDNWTETFIYGVGLLATLFRGIKLGGWFKHD